MPYVRLSAEHTESCKVLPDRKSLLARMPSGGQVMELGVADGTFSAEILEICQPKNLHLVDAWHTEAYKANRDQVLDRFKHEMAAGLVEVHMGLSTDILPTFSERSLDWIYIDTNHSYETTAAELMESERIVRQDGFIAGHDYCLGNIVKPAVFGVIQAVNEFCVSRSWRFKYITIESNGYFSFCLQRMAPLDSIKSARNSDAR